MIFAPIGINHAEQTISLDPCGDQAGLPSLCGPIFDSIRDIETRMLPSPAMRYMSLALKEAETALKRREIPVGAVLVVEDRIIAKASNRVEEYRDITAHAEILCLREAARRSGVKFMETADLYVTLEPCTMCAGAISAARIRRLYYGAFDPKSGGVEHGAKFFSQPTCHHRPEVYGGFLETRCQDLMTRFFTTLRTGQSAHNDPHPPS